MASEKRDMNMPSALSEMLFLKQGGRMLKGVHQTPAVGICHPAESLDATRPALGVCK